MLKTKTGVEMLIENATTFKERTRLTALTESEKSQVNATLVTNLYQSAIDKNHVDFEDIPNSKGDITRYKGYKPMREILTLLDELSKKYNNKIPELEIVNSALDNVVSFRDTFEKGFSLQKEFIILQYNTLVCACVEATSLLVATYVDSVKRPDFSYEVIINRDSNAQGPLIIENLNKFNKSVRTGDFSKVMQSVIRSGNENFAGSAVLTTMGVIAGLSMVIPVTRELIFGFYYTRMKLSEHLKQQASLLEIHRQSLEISSMPANTRKQIIQKQSAQIKRLYDMSEKIKVQHQIGDSNAQRELKKENKTWTLDTIQAQSSATDSGGFQLL